MKVVRALVLRIVPTKFSKAALIALRFGSLAQEYLLQCHSVTSVDFIHRGLSLGVLAIDA